MLNLRFVRQNLQWVSVVLAAAAAIPTAHADGGPGTPAAAQPLTRAEVKADLALWRRAKVDEYGAMEMTSLSDAERAKRLALYQSWRQGPEFQEELRRVQADQR